MKFFSFFFAIVCASTPSSAIVPPERVAEEYDVAHQAWVTFMTSEMRAQREIIVEHKLCVRAWLALTLNVMQKQQLCERAIRWIHQGMETLDQEFFLESFVPASEEEGVRCSWKANKRRRLLEVAQTSGEEAFQLSAMQSEEYWTVMLERCQEILDTLSGFSVPGAAGIALPNKDVRRRRDGSFHIAHLWEQESAAQAIAAAMSRGMRGDPEEDIVTAVWSLSEEVNDMYDALYDECEGWTAPPTFLVDRWRGRRADAHDQANMASLREFHTNVVDCIPLFFVSEDDIAWGRAPEMLASSLAPEADE